MCSLSGSPLFAAAVTAIDAANSADPGVVDVRGAGPRPLAQVHGELAAEWVGVLSSGLASVDGELVLLAARAHHLRRWELPRSQYPAGRAGYLQWKRDQRKRHADDVGALLAEVGYGADDIAAVQAMVLRQGDGGQLVEDAACLVFIETQLAAVATQLDHDHLLDVIRKTAKKMSPAALGAVASMPLGEVERSVLAAALG
ncbi:MAG: DUF4202 domain-containing protein [Ilumatobacteraceae bacterium]